MTQNIQPYQPNAIEPALKTFSTELSSYLEVLGLPSENVLVPLDQRGAVLFNMPTVIASLTPQQRLASMYISKVVAACTIGLFDAALNYIWDETIRNLREKVAHFDLEYFFDSVITDPDRRAKLKTEADLEKLDDWELIKGCQATGIISNIGFKHLDYIRDMRNWASAAHPNQNQLSGLQVATWLETCIREVLAKDPTGPAIEIKKLIHNLRNQQLTTADVAPIAATLPSLPDDLARSLLRTVVGMYTSTALPADARNNIKLLAPTIWDVCSDEARHEVGLTFFALEVNAEVQRAKLAREFLELVGGLAYLPPDRLVLEFSQAIDILIAAHDGFNNFYNESGPARMLQRLVPPSGVVPDAAIKKYVKTLVLCRIGNGYGVSWAAQPVYDDLIGRFVDKHAYWFAQLLLDTEVASRLQSTVCANRYRGLAQLLEPQTVNLALKQALQRIIAASAVEVGNLGTDSSYRQIFKTIGAKI